MVDSSGLRAWELIVILADRHFLENVIVQIEKPAVVISKLESMFRAEWESFIKKVIGYFQCWILASLRAVGMPGKWF